MIFNRVSIRKRISLLSDKKLLKLCFSIVLYLTVIISIFDYHPDLEYWLYEIGRNFVLINSITWTFYIFSVSFNQTELPSGFKKIFILIGLSIFVSILGGGIGWLLNSWMFGFNVSHPVLFFLMIFLITLFTVFAIQSYVSWKRAGEVIAQKKAVEERLIQLKSKAELEAIRSKINPHFLFNTLNSVMSLIPSEPEKAEEMLQKLSNLLRKMLQKKSDFVKLSEEIKFIEEYLQIEKIRFGSRLNYYIDTEAEINDEMIPAMILQPLVENSLKYEVSSSNGEGFIEIKAEKTNDKKLLLSVKDSGNGFNITEDSQGFGISSIKERLEFIYGDDYLFEIENRNGCCIKITIPSKNSV